MDWKDDFTVRIRDGMARTRPKTYSNVVYVFIVSVD